MKISKNCGMRLMKAYTSQTKGAKAGRPTGKVSGDANRCDRAVISSEARELQTIMAELRKLPEVREELVNSIKEKIDKGSYHRDSLKIAEGMIAEYHLDRK